MAADNEVNIKFGATIDDLKSKIGEAGGILQDFFGKFAGLAALAAGGAIFKSFIDATNQLNSEQMKLVKTLGMTGEDAATLNTALGDIGSDADTYAGAFLKFNRALRTNSEGMKELGVDVDGFTSGQKTSNQVFEEAIKIVMQYKPGIDQTQVAMQLFGRNVEDVQKLMRLSPALFDEARKKNEELNLSFSADSVAASKAYKMAMNDVGDVMTGLKNTVGQAVIPLFTQSAVQLSSIGPMLVDGMKTTMEVFVGIWDAMSGAVSALWSVISQVIGAIGGSIDEVFGKDAPSAMEIFKTVLRVVEAMFIGFRISVELVVDAVQTGLALLSNKFSTFASVADRALHLDFAGALAEWKDGTDRGNAILEAGMAKAVRIAEKGQADINRAVMTTAERKTEADQNYSHEGAHPAPAKPKKTLDHFGKNPKEGKSADQMAAKLALLKAENDAEMALELEHLKEAGSIYDDAYKNNLLTVAEFYDAKLAIEVKALDESLNAKRKELADAAKAEDEAHKSAAKAKKPGDAAKYDVEALKFKTEQVKLQGQINVLEAQSNDAVRKNAAERRNAEEKLADELRAIGAARTKAAADDEITSEKKVLDQKKALLQISAEEAFAVEKQLEQKSYDAAISALVAKRAAIHGDNEQAIKANAAIDAEEEGAEKQHQQKLSDIDRAAEMERQKYSVQAQQSIQSSFATMINGLLSGTQKLGDVFRNFGKSIQTTFTNLIAQKLTDKLFDATGAKQAIDKMVNFVTDGVAKMVMKWVTGKATETAADAAVTAKRLALKTSETAATTAAVATEVGATTAAEATKTAEAVTGDATRTASDEAASGIAMATQQAEGISAVLSYASIAAVAAMASVAAIPFVGWAMAPEVGAATYAMGLAYLASAAGGWDEVPHDQLAQVHKKEMVLSAPLAQGLRDLVGDGGLNPLNDSVEQLKTSVGLQQPEMPQAAAPAPAAPTSEVGKMVVRWQDGEQGGGAGNMGDALRKLQGMQAGEPVNAGWRLPANPLARIQSAAMDGGGQPAGGGAGGQRGGDVNLHVNALDGASVKRLFMEHGGALAASLRNQYRNGGSTKP